jgi:RNA polymerase primary sigma factor
MKSFAQHATQPDLPHFQAALVAKDPHHPSRPGHKQRDTVARLSKPKPKPTKQPRTGAEGRVDHDRWYFSAIGGFPLLAHEVVVALTQTVQRSEDENDRIDAQQKIVVANLRWITAIAREYTHISDLDLVDLVQEGVVGLMRATEKFDPSKGCRFLTYATFWIRHAVIRAIQNRGSTIRLPHHAHESLVAIRRSRASLSGVLQREPRSDEIAKELGEETSKVVLLLEASQRTDSLDRRVGPNEDIPMSELLAHQNSATAEECLQSRDTAKAVDRALDVLPERDRMIIRLRFGLDDDQEHTLAEIGRRFGVSIERIRQLEKRALARLGGCSALRDLGSG